MPTANMPVFRLLCYTNQVIETRKSTNLSLILCYTLQSRRAPYPQQLIATENPMFLVTSWCYKALTSDCPDVALGTFRCGSDTDPVYNQVGLRFPPELSTHYYTGNKVFILSDIMFDVPFRA